MKPSKSRINLLYAAVFFLFPLFFSLIFGPVPGEKVIEKSTPGENQSSDLNWSLPMAKKDDSLEAAMAVLKRTLPWGAAASELGNVIKTQWKFRGVVFSGSVYFALIELDGKVKRYKNGDLLVPGEKLLDVGKDFIQIAKDGEEFFLKLYN